MHGGFLLPILLQLLLLLLRDGIAAIRWNFKVLETEAEAHAAGIFICLLLFVVIFLFFSSLNRKKMSLKYGEYGVYACVCVSVCVCTRYTTIDKSAPLCLSPTLCLNYIFFCIYV